MKADALTVALRVHTEQVGKRSGRRRRSKCEGWPPAVLILDAETTADSVQRLLFLSYRYGRWRPTGTVDVREEGLVYADDLPERDPTGHAHLKAYATSHAADVGPDATTGLRLLSQREFLRWVLWRAIKADALVVGFNLPFDLSRLAYECGEARGRFRGGFSFLLWRYWGRRTKTWKQDPHRPRLCVKHIDSARAFFGLNYLPGWKGIRGRFLDLKTLAFALTGEKWSLESACRAFRTKHGKIKTGRHGLITARYIAYNRRDVLATQELLEALRREFDRHPVPLDAWQALSPASLAKAYLAAMGLSAPRGLPKRLLGASMHAYDGGRAEVRVRRVPLPVVHTDFLSMYPTVFALIGLADILRRPAVRVVDVTQAVNAMLAKVTLADVLQPAFWAQLAFLAQVEPDDDILPVRAQYDAAGDDLGIGVNHYSAPAPQWFAGPDVVASALLRGKPPRVRRALRFVASGPVSDLVAVKLRGQALIDPADDPFRQMIEVRVLTKKDRKLAKEERDRLERELKITVNAASYGVFAELTRHDLPKGTRVELVVQGQRGPFQCRTQAPEEAGAFMFPPLAALVTGAARLMLATLECAVRDVGGVHVFCDTDSQAIVASKEGGLFACPGGQHRLPDGRDAVKALSWDEVRAIVAGFAALNPYDPAVVSGSVLKIEKVNFVKGVQRGLWCFAISAKRYTFFELEEGGVKIIEPSEHGLGHLLSPTADHDKPGKTPRWIVEAWEWLVRRALGLPTKRPAWWHRPAVSRITASSPAVYAPFAKSAKGSAYADRVKPFGFLLSVTVDPLRRAMDADATRFHLVQPYSTDPKRWLRDPWVDIYSGESHRVTTRSCADADLVRVKTFGDIVAGYATHPEPKSADPAGGPCTRQTVGLLARRHVRADHIIYVGKEANRMEDVDAGLVHERGEVQSIYRDPEDDQLPPEVLAALKAIPRKRLAAETGVSERTIQAVRNGKQRPSPDLRAALTNIASA